MNFIKNCLLLFLVLVICSISTACVKQNTPVTPPQYQKNLVEVKSIFSNIDMGKGLSVISTVDLERKRQYEKMFLELQNFKNKYKDFSTATPDQLSQDLAKVFFEPIKILRRIRASSNENINDNQKSNVQTQIQPHDNGDIIIPPYSMVEWEAKGNCMDPRLPAPRNGDKFQFVTVNEFISPELLPIYQCIMKKSKTDAYIRKNQQKLVWALRTVDTPSRTYADSLNREQLMVLNSCMPNGANIFTEKRKKAISEAKARDSARRFVNKVFGGIRVAGKRYNFGDMLFDESKVSVEDHVAALSNMPINESIKSDGFEYGQISENIYTHAVGNGTLSLKVRIVNASNSPYIMNPTRYVAQPQRKVQRVSLNVPPNVRVTSFGNQDIARQQLGEDVNQFMKFINDFTPHLVRNLTEAGDTVLVSADLAVRFIDAIGEHLFAQIGSYISPIIEESLEHGVNKGIGMGVKKGLAQELGWELLSGTIKYAKQARDPQVPEIATGFFDWANDAIESIKSSMQDGPIKD